jgi:hypothetical protein
LLQFTIYEGDALYFRLPTTIISPVCRPNADINVSHIPT